MITTSGLPLLNETGVKGFPKAIFMGSFLSCLVRYSIKSLRINFLGGIAANYNTNFWSHERNVVVVEADEYDRSFLKLFPDIAIITSMDPDHLDIYGTAARFREAFADFSGKVRT
jgi:UDP-N-acetylmuramate-alanine ligase